MPTQNVNPNVAVANVTGVDTNRDGTIDRVAVSTTTTTGVRTGIYNIDTPEGRAAAQQALLDLGLNMPEFLSPGAERYVGNLSQQNQTTLRNLGQAVGGLTAQTSGATGGAVTADVQGRWADFIAGLSSSGGVDVNALVQAVLREAYMDNTQDLAFYAQKVRFFNELKKRIRTELTDAREFLSKQVGKKPEDAVTGTYQKVDFPVEPVPEMKLDPATGQMVRTGAMVPADPINKGNVTTKEDLDTYITNLETKLNSVGDDAQLANVDLQNMLQKQQQTLQMMSNISKMLHDTAMAIIRKIGG